MSPCLRVPPPRRCAACRSAGTLAAPLSALIDEFGFRTRGRRVAALSGILVGFREDKLNLAVGIEPDFDVPAIDQATEQQLVYQGAAYRVLNEPLHGTRAHGGIEAFFGQMLAQRIGKRDVDALLVKLIFK